MNTIDKLCYIENLLFNKIEDTEIDLSEEECDNIANYSKDIRKELRQLEKSEKAVEIIKNHKALNHIILMGVNDYINEREEFDLLKEVFENE